MEYLFFGLLVVMLLLVWYAREQRGVVRTWGGLSLTEEDDLETR